MSNHPSPDAGAINARLNRRTFLRQVGAAAATVGGSRALADAAKLALGPSPRDKAETAVKALYEALSEKQRQVVYSMRRDLMQGGEVPREFILETAGEILDWLLIG